MSSVAQPGKAYADPCAVDASHYRVEYEDDRVRVLRIRYGPRERSAMHGHPAMIAVVLTAGKMRFAYPDGKAEEIEATPGQMLQMPAMEHLPENLTDQVFEAIGVELK